MSTPGIETQSVGWPKDLHACRASEGERSGPSLSGDEIFHCPLKPSSPCSKSYTDTQVAPLSVLVQRGLWGWGECFLERASALEHWMYLHPSSGCVFLGIIYPLWGCFLNHKSKIINLPHRVVVRIKWSHVKRPAHTSAQWVTLILEDDAFGLKPWLELTYAWLGDGCLA